jgi:hypothetical protein
MSILQNKKDIEQIIFDNWTLTPIHWSGVPFDITDKTEWIRCQYEPSSISNRSIDGDKKYDGIIKLAIFSKTEFRTYELMDTAYEMFNNKKIGENFETGVDILSTGLTVDKKFYYSDMTIDITSH